MPHSLKVGPTLVQFMVQSYLHGVGLKLVNTSLLGPLPCPVLPASPALPSKSLSQSSLPQALLLEDPT